MADISNQIASAIVSPYITRGQMQQQMPFPDNHNPDMDFVNRWPAQLPPSGILNDLKAPNPDLPLARHLDVVRILSHG